MKKNRKKVIAILLYLFIAMTLAAAAGDYIYSFMFDKTYAATYKEKLDRLRELDGKKAVFVGGSSCMFGIHTKLFEEDTGIQSVNMAVSAGIPMKFYLDSIDDYLNQGDDLILAFEYMYYSYDWNMVGESGLNFLMYQDSSIISEEPALNLVKSIPDIYTFSWRNWENYAQETVKNNLLGGFGVYCRDSINENGDMVATQGRDNGKVEDGTYINFKDIGTIAGLQEEINRLSENGVNVYIVYQPVLTSTYNNSKASISEIRKAVCSLENVTVLGIPEDYVYPLNYFYDTVDHLNYESGIVHTENIIKAWNGSEIETADSNSK